MQISMIYVAASQSQTIRQYLRPLVEPTSPSGRDHIDRQSTS